ncbi:MAG: prepilin peptidase [Candidatus Diapherotrites archaeon]|nr:prepilin peptidase [Candidatus Diapherotrites archaeon]
METELLKAGLVVAAAIAAAYWDARTGLIPDWITLPLIGIGAVLAVLEFNLTAIGTGIIVFGAGYAFYWLGKLGGGDVKLFAGMGFLLPFWGGKIFLLSMLFFAALSSLVFYAVYWGIQAHRKKIMLKIKSRHLQQGILLLILLGAYLLFLNGTRLVPVSTLLLLGIPLLCGVILSVLEPSVREHLMLTRIPLNELEEDEVLAREFLEESAQNILQNHKGVLGKKEIQALATAGIRSVPVYRNLPRFGPFIAIGTILALLLPPLAGLGGII